MSYDLYLLLPVPDEEPLATAHARLETESSEINPGLPHPHKEARKTQLMGALKHENPIFQPFEFGYSDIAQKYGISEEEARIRYRHIELNGAEDGNGLLPAFEYVRCSSEQRAGMPNSDPGGCISHHRRAAIECVRAMVHFNTPFVIDS